MRIQLKFSIILSTLILISCSTQKKVITSDDLSSDQIIIIGLVENDYTQLKNKNIKGIELYLDSKEEYSDYKLPNKYLPFEFAREYEFICKVGKMGEYDLLYKNPSETPETDNLLALMGQQRISGSSNRRSLIKYSFNDGKIIYLGKLIVRYQGGDIETGSINYSYSFDMDDNDTLALYAFKQTYPLIYSKYQNDIYVFKNDYQESLDFILTNLSEGKRLFINNMIQYHPKKVEFFFNDLSPLTQNRYLKIIEESSFEQLTKFINKIEE